MLKKIFFSLIAIVAFSASVYSAQQVVEETAIVIPTFKDRFYYVKLGGGFFTMPDVAFGPTTTLGCRFEEWRYALDISVNYAAKGNQFMATLPKALYLCYLNPNASNGYYVGGGASFGWINGPREKSYGLEKGHKVNFAGLLAEMSVGYDFNRLGKAKVFIEATLSQPFISVKTDRHSSFAPVFTLSYGIGF